MELEKERTHMEKMNALLSFKNEVMNKTCMWELLSSDLIVVLSQKLNTDMMVKLFHLNAINLAENGSLKWKESFTKVNFLMERLLEVAIIWLLLTLKWKIMSLREELSDILIIEKNRGPFITLINNSSSRGNQELGFLGSLK